MIMQATTIYAAYATALEKPRNDSKYGAPVYNFDFAAISCYILKMVQDKVEVTIKREYEVICDLSNALICKNFERPFAQFSRS